MNSEFLVALLTEHIAGRLHMGHIDVRILAEGPPAELGSRHNAAEEGGMNRFSILVLLIPIVAAGCSRAFYRIQADDEVYHLVDRADQQVKRPPPDKFTIAISPKSRMFDPFDPDFPPMPPDDPSSCSTQVPRQPCQMSRGRRHDTRARLHSWRRRCAGLGAFRSLAFSNWTASSKALIL